MNRPALTKIHSSTTCATEAASFLLMHFISLICSSFPSEDFSSKLLNRGARTTFFALKKDVSPLCAVDQVIHILETERTQTIVKFDRPEVSDLVRAFKNSKSLDGRVSWSKLIFNLTRCNFVLELRFYMGVN